MKPFIFPSILLSLGSQIRHAGTKGFVQPAPLAFPISAIFRRIFLIMCIFLFFASGCTAPSKEIIKDKPLLGDRVAISEDYAVVIAGSSDTYESLAGKYYGDKALAYIIADFNKNQKIVPDKAVIVPLKQVNPGGLYAEGYQMVTILCYHQFSKRRSTSKISVSEEMFDEQMAYLKNSGYNVISLKTLHNFINYKRRPPKNSVVITIDDGWKTVKTVAAPVLKKYGFKATLFVYTDLIKSKPNNMTLCWDELKEMVDEGVIEVQSHTVSHVDLTKLKQESLEKELEESRDIIKEKVGITPSYIAYPYGNFNDQVVDKLKKYGYEVGFTVIRGGNAFFHNNFALNRSMVFNSEKIEAFTKLLDTYKQE